MRCEIGALYQRISASSSLDVGLLYIYWFLSNKCREECSEKYCRMDVSAIVVSWCVGSNFKFFAKKSMTIEDDGENYTFRPRSNNNK